MNGFDAYNIYQAIRLHFINDKYDYFGYYGKTRTSEETFNMRKDKYTFHKIARLYNAQELPIFFAVNFLKRDGKVWISGMLQEEAIKNYNDWISWQKGRVENFTKDLKKLSKLNFQELIVCKNGQFPELLNLVFQNEIAYDSLVIIDHFIKLTDVWNTKIEDDFIWTEFYKKFKKYVPFFLYHAPLSDPYYKKLLVEYLTINK